ncbi:pre-B-cell leukemia homeobox interacting protein 1b isoform X2 [Nelusetta ayraudi]|uniref:pre-B-cell leukemia homeobox interacting protein 1b isoform X2 n=1 Tax=Nelusetta ayraudi TaxID=303726 RepID=UPI003F6F1D4B
MSGGSGANNSWTILTSESVAEPLKPSAEGTDCRAEEPTPASVIPGSEEKQPASSAQPAEGRPLEGEKVPGGKPDELTSDTNTEQRTSPTAAVGACTAVASSVGFSSDSDALSQSEGLPEGPAVSAHDPDLFSDSYSHIAPSPDEPSATQLSIETLGGAEPAQEEQRLSREGSAHHLSEEKGTHDGAEPEICERTGDVGKPAESPVESEVGEQKTAEEASRRRSLLAALERIGRTEEEEEKEEELQPPQRDEGSGFTVNKCILGAVILVGIGTVFFSGVFMDLDEGSDYNTRELRDSELPTKQEDWLNLEALPPVDADNKELLNKLAKGNEQISVLNAQIQAQKEELKVAKGQAAEGVKERLRWEEVERENTAPETAQTSTTSHSSSQPEDGVPSTADGQPKTGKNKEVKEEKKKREERLKEKSGRDREKGETKDEGKTEWKKEKHDSGKFDKEKYNRDKQKKNSAEPKQEKEKDWKREKASRGDEGKTWKDREGGKERREKNERKEWNEEKDWKKSRHGEVSDGKQWQGKKKKEEKRDWEVGMEHGEKHRGKEEWKGESKWKKGKDGVKEQWQTKEGKKDDDRSRNGKDHRKEGKWEGEKKKKPWEESKNPGRDGKGKDGGGPHKWRGDNGKSDAEGKRKAERKQGENKWRSKKDKSEEGWKSRSDEEDKEWKRKDRKESGKKKEEEEQQHWKRGEDADTTGSHRHKSEGRSSHGHQGAHMWGERKPAHTHRRRPSPGQPEYWDLQRSRMQHNPRASECGSAEACARAEGLRPVTASEFQAVLQAYLARAGELGADAAVAEQLSGLTAEFFTAEEGGGGGMFAHDRVDFRDFAEDVSDVLEDLVEGGGAGEEDGESSALEDEMEEFQREVVTRFSLPGAGEGAEWGKGSGRARA